MKVLSIKPNYFLYLTIGIFFLYHVLALPLSPLPWFDETYFASMALHFLETGEFKAPVGPLIDHYYPQSKAYGPGYFIVLAGMIKAFGFGIFQIRFAALAFGFLFFIVFFKILRQQGVHYALSVPGVILLLFDPIFLQNIHSARMDSMAIFFTGLGIYFEINGLKTNRLKDFLLCGLFFGLALLTTPRIAVCLIGPCIILMGFFFRNLNFRSLLPGFIVLVSIVSLYSIWVFWGFGGYYQAYLYFFGAPKEMLAAQNLADSYVGSNFFIPTFQKPTIALAGILALFGLFNTSVWKRYLFWISLFNIFSYYILVADTGIYSILNMPFVYILIIICIQDIRLPKNINSSWIIAPIMAINLGIFCFKNMIVWINSNQRDNSNLISQIRQFIPKGSRVIGDDPYYYAVMQSGSDFQYIERGSHTYMRRDYHEKVFNYQYLVIQDPPKNKQELAYYTQSHALEPIASLEMKPNPPWTIGIQNLLSRFHIEIPPGYKGMIFKRK